MKDIFVSIALGACITLPVQAQSSPELLVTVNTGNPQTQGMALVLATAASEQKAVVRVLLCSEGGQLAIKGKESVVLKPKNVTPKDMLQGLIKNGSKVEVCALFLPNSEWKPADLIEGVAVAKPSDIAAYILQPGVKAISY
jgi:predicted peroxiredoxin